MYLGASASWEISQVDAWGLRSEPAQPRHKGWEERVAPKALDLDWPGEEFKQGAPCLGLPLTSVWNVHVPA